jgi:hypothetical protein
MNFILEHSRILGHTPQPYTTHTNGQTSLTVAMVLLTIVMMLLKSPDDEMGKKVTDHGDTRNACETFVAKHEEKKSLRRPEFKWWDNIKTDVK